MKTTGSPCRASDGDADFHAAGRNTYIAEFFFSGVSLVEAKELARHGDVRMTMQYAHIGLKDQTKAIKKLPINSRWKTGLREEEMAETSKCIRSEAGALERRSKSLSDTGRQLGF